MPGTVAGTGAVADEGQVEGKLRSGPSGGGEDEAADAGPSAAGRESVAGYAGPGGSAGQHNQGQMREVAADEGEAGQTPSGLRSWTSG